MAITNILGSPDGPPYILNSGSAQSRDLLFWAPMGSAGAVQDPVQRLILSQAVAGGAAVPYMTPFGLGIDCSAVNRGFRAAAPASLNALLPVSLMVVFWQVGTPSSNAAYFSVTYTNSDTTPFNQYEINVDSSIHVRLSYNTAGTSVGVVGSATPANGAFHVAIGTLATGSQVIWLDGVNTASASAAVSAATSVTPQVSIGCYTSDQDASRTCGAIILDARIYGRALSNEDVRAFTDQWTDLYYQPRTRFAKRRTTTDTSEWRGCYPTPRRASFNIGY